MTIHNYRSASPALYCPSTLYVNNYYYNCSPYNGFSANDKVENEILPSDRETAVTLIFQSQSNQPILRLEFKGKQKQASSLIFIVFVFRIIQTHNNELFTLSLTV